MNSLKDLLIAMKRLRIPSGNDHDLTGEDGVAAHRADWRTFESRADGFVKNIVRANALDAFGSQSKLAEKVKKHIEKWRIHARGTTDIWDRTWEWLAQKGEFDGYDSFLGWLGVKSQRQAWIVKEEKDIQRLTDRLTKENADLYRKYEFLLIELDALIME